MFFPTKRLVFALLVSVSLTQGSPARHLLQYDKANLKSDLEKLNLNLGDVNCPEVRIRSRFTVPSIFFEWNMCGF
jgi:hypothetical protein